MKLGKIIATQAICVLTAWLSIGCDRKDEPIEPVKHVKADEHQVELLAEPDPLQVIELKRRKEEMMEKIATMKSDATTLKREISELEEKSSVVEADLAEVKAFKDEVAKNLKELEKHLAEEFNGNPPHPDTRPLHEIAESMIRRIKELAEENDALKKKLEERTK